MKTYLDCLPCMINQALRAGRIATNDDEKIKQILDEVGAMIKDIPMYQTPVQSGMFIYNKISEITGITDPYKKLKKESIDEALEIYPALEKLMDITSDSLEKAIRIAIAGNIIDFGVNQTYDIKSELVEIMDKSFAINDYRSFRKNVQNAKSILYIGDNAGESVFDRILIKTLGKPVTYVVRDAPIINDVTYQDAIDSGIDEVADIISSGSTAPGTVLELCNKQFIAQFNNAEMIISKGQGNYESLSDSNRPIFFLLKAKCEIIADDLGVNKNDIILKGINI